MLPHVTTCFRKLYFYFQIRTSANKCTYVTLSQMQQDTLQSKRRGSVICTTFSVCMSVGILIAIIIIPFRSIHILGVSITLLHHRFICSVSSNSVDPWRGDSFGFVENPQHK